MLHKWHQSIHGDDGNTVTVKVEANWDPDHELTKESVQQAACLRAWWESGKGERKVKFFPTDDPVLVS